MTDRLPLAEVSGDEILARVVYQIILFDYREHPDSYDIPVVRVLELADQFHAANMSIIAADLRLAAIWCGNGGTIATWLRARIVFRTQRFSRARHAGRNQTR
jgi:hypothetical protein